MRIFFLEKTAKIVSASGAPPLNPHFLRRLGSSPSDSRDVIPAYYYNFVEFVSSAKCIQKRTKNYSKCSAFACSVLLHVSFNLNSVSFVEGGHKNISRPRAQDILATPLVGGSVSRPPSCYSKLNFSVILSTAQISRYR